MTATYYTRVKKKYAAAIIEDLQLMDALEIIGCDDNDVPGWQVELGIREILNVDRGNTELVPWEEAKKQLKL